MLLQGEIGCEYSIIEQTYGLEHEAFVCYDIKIHRLKPKLLEDADLMLGGFSPLALLAEACRRGEVFTLHPNADFKSTKTMFIISHLSNLM